MNKFIAFVMAAALPFFLPLPSQAQTAAQDKASNPAYAKGYGQGQNGGTGFKPFVVKTTGTAGTFVFTAAEAEGNGGHPSPRSIDSSGKSFGLFAQKKGSVVTIRRSFAQPLTARGSSFALDFVGGFNDTGTAGVALLTAHGTAGGFVFHGGGPGVLFNGKKTGIGYVSGASHLVYTLIASTTYSLTVTGADRFSGTGTFSGPITGFQIQQTSSGSTKTDHNAYFNNLSVNHAPK